MHHRPTRAARVAACSALAAATVAALPASALAAPSQIIDTTARSAPAAAFDRLAAQADAAPSGRTRVIVTLKARFDASDAASKTAASRLDRQMRGIQDAVRSKLTGTDRAKVSGVDGQPYLALDASEDALRALQDTGEVAAIQPDRLLKPQLASTTPVIESVGQVARGWDGSGRVVAIIEQGFDTSHPFFADRVVEEACFKAVDHPGLGGSVLPCPNGESTQVGPGASYHDNNHGTHVAGIAVGRRTLGVNFDGVAPDAALMPISFSSSTVAPGLFQSDIMHALAYVRDRALAGVPVAAVNLSQGDETQQGDTCDADPMKSSIDQLLALGIPTIIAAGNAGSTTNMAYPACISSAITVGSTSPHDQVSFFSNSTQRIDLLAPGEGPNGTKIISSVHDFGGSIWGGSRGTSMAAPHVAGAWATYLERHPGASVEEVLAQFQRTGKPILDTRNGLNLTRYRINLSAALARTGYVVADQPTSSAYNPSRQFNSMNATNSVSRTSTGTYTVTLPKLGPSGYGNVHLQAYGSTTNRCESAGLNWSQPRIAVRCKTVAGAAADTPFLVRFEVNETKRSSGAAYLTSLEPLLAEHTPEPQYQSNSAGATNVVTRTGTGQYSIEHPGMTTTGVPHVTALGAGSSCQLTVLGSTSGAVACYSAQGARIDAPLSYTTNTSSTFTGGRGASLYASNPTSTTAYTPTTRWNSTGATNTVRKVSTGTYQVTMPGIPAATSIPTVTAAGTASATVCRPVSWADGTITVGCVNSSGAAVDSRFSVSYASKNA